MFTGIKSIIYPSSDLNSDKEFWTKVLGAKPYFDESYYVGFSIEGCELGLDPNATKEGLSFPVGYWHVKNASESAKLLANRGVEIHGDLRDVGGGMMMATFKDASGNIFGIIDDPKA